MSFSQKTGDFHGVRGSNLPVHTEQKIISPHWEAFLRALADRIAESTPDQLTVRCWNRTSFATMVQDIKRSKLPSNFPDTPEILKHLINIGWAYPIDVDVEPTKTSRSNEFFLLDVGAAHGIKVDPLELLQASKPDGVICYFSALTYHSLTTQFATHHHIATIYKKPSVQKLHSDISVIDYSDKSVSSSRKDSLGNNLFTYQGIPFYLIKRSPTLLVGVQTRIFGPRTNLRITTLEQTLLDTLNKPKYCGGPSIVFEAWKEGMTRLDEDLLNEYLQKIDSSLLLRRVGAMFDMFDFTSCHELKSTLESALELSSPNVMEYSVPILPGLEFPVLNPKWKVTIP